MKAVVIVSLIGGVTAGLLTYVFGQIATMRRRRR